MNSEHEQHEGHILRKTLRGEDYASYVVRTEERDYQFSLMNRRLEIGDTIRFYLDGNGAHAELIKANVPDLAKRGEG